MRRSEAPACIELYAETVAGLAVLTILSDITWFPNRVWSACRVSSVSLTDSCVFRTLSLLTLTMGMYWRPLLLARTAPQAQVQRAFAAVAGVRFLETDDKAAELRQRQP
jgi:hypothetical protein